jgi:hypothetical protein
MDLPYYIVYNVIFTNELKQKKQTNLQQWKIPGFITVTLKVAKCDGSSLVQKFTIVSSGEKI